MAQASKQTIEHHKRREILRPRQPLVAAPDDEAQDDVAREAQDPRPLPAHAIHEPHAEQHAGDGKDGQDKLPDGHGADVLAGHEAVDDGGAHDAVGKVDKVVEEEGGARSQAAEPVPAEDEAPGDRARLEIGALEERPVRHAEAEEHDEEGEDGADAVDGVEGDLQIVVRGQQREQVY